MVDNYVSVVFLIQNTMSKGKSMRLSGYGKRKGCFSCIPLFGFILA